MYFGPVRKVSEIPPRGVRTTHYPWNRRFCQTAIPGSSDLTFDVERTFRNGRLPASCPATLLEITIRDEIAIAR
jgi:hypothetical protein